MKKDRYDCGIAWLPDGRIFVIGGRSGDTASMCLSSVEVLRRRWRTIGATTKEWREIAPLNVARANHGVAVFHEHIIVAGGETDTPKGVAHLSSVEMLSLPTDNADQGQWTEICNLTRPMTVCSLVLWSGKLYAFGKSYIHHFMSHYKYLKYLLKISQSLVLLSYL